MASQSGANEPAVEMALPAEEPADEPPTSSKHTRLMRSSMALSVIRGLLNGLEPAFMLVEPVKDLLEVVLARKELAVRRALLFPLCVTRCLTCVDRIQTGRGAFRRAHGKHAGWGARAAGGLGARRWSCCRS